MLIRKGTYADIETIANYNCLMAMQTEGKTLHWDTVYNGVKAAMDDPQKGFYLLAEVEGKPAGSLMITYEWSDWRNCNMWWVQSVYVDENYRRQGVYTALYAEAKKLAIADGAKIIRLYVEHENTGAQSTYEALGMEKSNYIMYEEVVAVIE